MYKDGVPARYELLQNFPNPFNPVTKIFFALPQKSRVGLVIYDAAGRRVRVLVNGEMESGLHSVIWNGQNERGRRVASGVYFYRLLAGDFEQTKKMLLLK
jgi:flagellar hook assembly protein FlgD